MKQEQIKNRPGRIIKNQQRNNNINNHIDRITQTAEHNETHNKQKKHTNQRESNQTK